MAAGTGGGGGMTERGHISRTRRLALFRDQHGRCHLCSGFIKATERWELEHVIPLAMGGADDETNWALAHTKCHKSKTVRDLLELGRAKRREAKHLGAKRSRKEIPGWRRFDGTTVKNPRA